MMLGVNQQNQRAQRFYTKHGFTINGTKNTTFSGIIGNTATLVPLTAGSTNTNISLVKNGASRIGAVPSSHCASPKSLAYVCDDWRPRVS